MSKLSSFDMKVISWRRIDIREASLTSVWIIGLLSQRFDSRCGQTYCSAWCGYEPRVTTQTTKFFMMFAGESETFRLQNTWFKKCLSDDGVSGSIPVGRDCDVNDGRQEWRWINNLVLKNINSHLCLQRFTADPVFRMENCDPSLEGQHFAGTFNFIRSTLSPVVFLCLVSSPFELSICPFSSVPNRWKIYGASGEKSICGNPGMRILSKNLKNYIL